MTTAFQPNAFQPDAFQVEGGVTSGAITGTMAYTNRDDTFSGVASLGTDELLTAKFIARPNVRIKALVTGPAPTPPPLPAQITNMPGAPRTRGLDLTALDAVALAPLDPLLPPAPPVAPPLIVRGAPPASADPAPPAAEPTPPAKAPAVAAAPAPVAPPKPAPAPKPDPHTLAVEALSQQMADLQAGVDALLNQVAAMRSQEKARELHQRNQLRAQEITRRLLEDLMNSD